MEKKDIVMDVITPMKMKEEKWKDRSCQMHAQRTAAYCRFPILCNSELPCHRLVKQLHTLPVPQQHTIVDCSSNLVPSSIAALLPTAHHRHFDSALLQPTPTKAPAPDQPRGDLQLTASHTSGCIRNSVKKPLRLHASSTTQTTAHSTEAAGSHHQRFAATAQAASLSFGSFRHCMKKKVHWHTSRTYENNDRQQPNNQQANRKISSNSVGSTPPQNPSRTAPPRRQSSTTPPRSSSVLRTSSACTCTQSSQTRASEPPPLPTQHCHRSNLPISFLHKFPGQSSASTPVSVAVQSSAVSTAAPSAQTTAVWVASEARTQFRTQPVTATKTLR
ncbi:uncharacterized protein MONOS_8778 [Monocercomonoides exilis]|uniref:uncharacterized protein n=1 Tax=Monocercomonoides exilis TaxID=2049356 RepID=UPI00355AB1AA|nr:hypothetical protein MONOS_8778 [Monocercomonoides exilis]|eukprot:MONOS_8778.1-p1 / transcript=MONOS_8778.1 / gene=MONOS_8778 / organism=Monocercomonoides_exilis_PA203 / gene_product=unspecified product / transcript_product=unspecified product / location=Mono_scaffold00341:997-2426(-) / protein_length=332 / sequence_SO=supercontig / SO=protein_coding / is_pseudo=false